MRPRAPVPRPAFVGIVCGLALLVVPACGGRETGRVDFDPTPNRGDGLHEVRYQASCRSGAECVVTFGVPRGGYRQIFGSQWSHQFPASPGQQLYLGVTVRRRCTGSYRMGSLRCSQAAGSARVTIYVDGERVANDITFHRPRGIVPDYSFGVSTRYRIPTDSLPADPDSTAAGEEATAGPADTASSAPSQTDAGPDAAPHILP